MEAEKEGQFTCHNVFALVCQISMQVHSYKIVAQHLKFITKFLLAAASLTSSMIPHSWHCSYCNIRCFRLMSSINSPPLHAFSINC